ncbi:hypothetical protein LOTGIDRAFT_156478 [Lottia gigantea]|uniref:Transmembrane protein n=1 Tax=Lottia gigantea TaxID=225164 RepID=V4B973_LOTGI|nr:hypothetical protein LOTGIDRAFT_156478 [Lottia gigantea]ESP03881.1 hypothetical protein LOTGIDRAFT_156478 [Lottia gigantea]
MACRVSATMFFVSLCVIFLMETEVLRAANPSNTSSQTVTDEQSDLIVKKSSIEKGMDVLYDMANGFLDVVQSEKLFDQTWLTIYLIYFSGRDCIVGVGEGGLGGLSILLTVS